jgi:hypothetical protein
LTKKQEIAKIYADLRKKLRRNVKISDLKSKGISKDMVRHYWDSLRKLDKAARRQYPDKFFDLHVDEIFSRKCLETLRDAVGNCKKFVITTAVVGAPVDRNFLASIKVYCKTHNAKMLVLLSADPSSTSGNTVDKILQNEHIVFEDTELNSNFFISTIKLSSKQIDPITSLDRIGQRHGSFIYASPKQRMLCVPLSNNELPHALMTTGALTLPAYHTDNYMSERTSYIADNDHVMGAVIVEIENEKIFHFRQVQADSKGRFADLGYRYSAKGQVKYNPAAIVLGDWHSGETDPEAERSWQEMLQLMPPKYLVIHDVFNGLSINHHEEKNTIIKAQHAAVNKLDLKQELTRVAEDLNMLAKYCDSIIIVKSNHDEFLERYLAEGKYVQDPQNHYLCLDLAKAMIEGKDPLKFGVEMQGLNSKKINWLSRDEDFKIARVQLGAHGDKGANGARGSLRGMERAYGNSVTAHTHTPQILRGAWCVGTSSLLKLSYNVGPSSWLHSSCIVYPNGARQLINAIDGVWRLKDHSKSDKDD